MEAKPIEDVHIIKCGNTSEGEVILNVTPENGDNILVFTPDQARYLAQILIEKAALGDQIIHRLVATPYVKKPRTE